MEEYGTLFLKCWAELTWLYYGPKLIHIAHIFVHSSFLFTQHKPISLLPPLTFTSHTQQRTNFHSQTLLIVRRSMMMLLCVHTYFYMDSCCASFILEYFLGTKEHFFTGDLSWLLLLLLTTLPIPRRHLHHHHHCHPHFSFLYIVIITKLKRKERKNKEQNAGIQSVKSVNQCE